MGSNHIVTYLFLLLFLLFDNRTRLKGLARAFSGEVEDTVGPALLAVQLTKVGIRLPVRTANGSLALRTFTFFGIIFL